MKLPQIQTHMKVQGAQLEEPGELHMPKTS